MEAVFLKLLNMSLTASWLILAVLLLRLIFRKAPRWIFCLLWGLVALRLICPVTVESALSLVPGGEPVSQAVIYTTPPASSAVTDGNAVTTPLPSEPSANRPDQIATAGQLIFRIGSYVWLTGMVGMLLYCVLSYLLLKRKVATATKLCDNIRQSEQVESPFVMGIFRPKIYLPYQMAEGDMRYVIAHEKAHIRRKDHWWKPMGFLILSVYWFHPGVWAAYILLCRDIEAACDEKVIGKMEMEDRRGYSTALLNCSVHRRSIAACPLAFGETGVKQRIKSVMNYKKPAFWIIILAVLTSAVVAVCFLTQRKARSEENFFEGQLLCVEIQDSNGSELPDTEGRFQYFPLEAAGNLTLSGGVPVDFSIDEVTTEAVRISFESGLLLNGEQLWDIRLEPGQSVRLLTPTPGGTTVYTFSIAAEEQSPQRLYELLDQIVNQEEAALSSNPYDYIQKSSAAYEEILSYGSLTVDCFLAELRSTENYGLREYIMAAACSELTGIGVKEGQYDTTWWATAGEWLALYDRSNSVSGTETANRLPVGVYIPTQCAYMNPLSSYSAINLSREYRYIVTEDSFITEYLPASGAASVPVDWKWESPYSGADSTIQADWQSKLPKKLRDSLSFLEETSFYELAMDESCLYQQIGGDCLLQSRGKLYLIRPGPRPNAKGLLNQIWSVYVLTPAEEVSEDAGLLQFEMPISD